MVEGSILFEEVRVGKGAIVRNSIIGPGAVIQGGSIVRGLCVLGADACWRKETFLTRERE
jgi:ADP-glucose pyrophosphorylase